MVNGVRSTITEIRACCRNPKSKACGHLVDSKATRHATICYVKGTYVKPETVVEKKETKPKKEKKKEKTVPVVEPKKEEPTPEPQKEIVVVPKKSRKVKSFIAIETE